MIWSKPETSEIRAALQRVAPWLAEATISPMLSGWEFWAYEVAGHVIRFPRKPVSIKSLELERTLLPELASYLSAPVPRITIWDDSGPNGAPFAGHEKLPGTTFWEQRIRPGPRFGVELGRLLRELHAFPVERAEALGVRTVDGPAWRQEHVEHYEDVIRRVFPLISCEARSYVQKGYERFLNEPSNFAFEPRFAHQDLDVNTLIEPDSGAITGLIDFGAGIIGSISTDYWLPLCGFERLGIGEQSATCLAQSGISPEELERIRPAVEFIDLRYPLFDILHGLDTNDSDYVEGGISALNKMVPSDIECA